MTHPSPADRPLAVEPRSGALRLGPTVDSEITWLLHRVAQRMHSVTGAHAERLGISLREYILLSAMHKTPGLAQTELGQALGLDKTTLTSQLDRLEKRGLVERRQDAHDRRARIPVITEAGERLRSAVASACAGAEARALSSLSTDEVHALRRVLVDIIGDNTDPGSCL
jgi:MarR family transcriptional regulator, organic hydroperoxide resistance regulator